MNGLRYQSKLLIVSISNSEFIFVYLDTGYTPIIITVILHITIVMGLVSDQHLSIISLDVIVHLTAVMVLF